MTKTLIELLVIFFVVIIFIYSKLKFVETKLYPKYARIFLQIKKVIEPILNFTSTILKPFKIGENLFIDSSQIIIIIILLFILRS
ncbi:MAG: hypothetical protein ACI9Y7_000472 [Dokdonia sp.]|jgi:hypothetical protein